MDGIQHNDKARLRKENAQARGRRKVEDMRDRRRFKAAAPPDGVSRVVAPKGLHRSMFTNRAVRWGPGVGEDVLKDGALNSKIGGDVLRGHLRGARIFTFSLEERATCPKSCPVYRSCYGNNMPRARRWKPSKPLLAQIAREVAQHCSGGKTILIRLHVLGDFYSFDYLSFWVDLLDRHPRLHVFGFTAHRRGTKLGDGIARVRKALGKRFAIRHSGVTGPWGAFLLDFPTREKTIGDAVVCPEQRSAIGDLGADDTTHCGSCALCWTSNRPIAFIKH